MTEEDFKEMCKKHLHLEKVNVKESFYYFGNYYPKVDAICLMYDDEVIDKVNI